MRLIVWITLLLAALHGGIALGQTGDAAASATVEKAYERHMALGVRLYEDRSFDAALIEFERAYELLHGAGPLINIALCHKGRAEYVKAARVLERALADHRGQTDQVAQMELALWELRELIAVVELSVKPLSDNVTVFVDGEQQAPGAHTKPLQISPGIHALRVSAEGFWPHNAELKLGAGDRRTVQIDLVPDSGTLAIDVIGAAARVSVDGAPEPDRPVRRLLKAGTHLLTLERGDARYTASVAIVAAAETRVVLDSSGLLHLGDSAPRGADEVEREPISGFYLLTGFSTGGRVGARGTLGSGAAELSSVIFFLGPDLHLGYRLTRNFGVEGYVRQLFSDSIQAPNSVTQVGAGVRVMTNQEPIYFAAAAGTGIAVEAPNLGGGGLTAFHAYVEPQVVGEREHFSWGFGTPLTFMVGAYAPNIELSARLQLGYGTW